eukprot:751181-Amphidinium_carterae.1
MPVGHSHLERLMFAVASGRRENSVSRNHEGQKSVFAIFEEQYRKAVLACLIIAPRFRFLLQLSFGYLGILIPQPMYCVAHCVALHIAP